MQAGNRDIVIIKRILSLAFAVLSVVLILIVFQLMSIAGRAIDDPVHYGRELIEHTAVYLGPNGTVARISNGMNCQNCHLERGTKLYAINYYAVASTYPKFRHRSGTIEGFGKRINDCIERSLNGKPLPDTSREMQAIIAYLKWLGKDVKVGTTPKGSGLPLLAYLDRAADPNKGMQVYTKHCASCHGVSGRGVKHDNKVEWLYPPLWGNDSYNTAAGLYRLSKLAAFVRANMPYGVSYDSPVLSVEESWDVAAYISSMPRPRKDFAGDWPDLDHKPVDHPFGPYADRFSEIIHKYGPFQQIEKTKRE